MVLLVTYLVMYFNTNNLIKDFKDILNNNTSESVNYGKLERYRISDDINMSDVSNIDISIYRMFVFHNFNKGIAIINYSYSVNDVNG